MDKEKKHVSESQKTMSRQWFVAQQQLVKYGGL